MIHNKQSAKMMNIEQKKELTFAQSYQFLLDEKDLEDIYEIGEILGKQM